MRNRLPWAIIVVGLVAVFVFWRTTRPQNDNPTPVPTAGATAVPPTRQPEASQPEPSQGLAQIYYNSEGNFSLLLPTDWVVGEAQTVALGKLYGLGPKAAEGSTILVAPAGTTQEQALAQVICEGCTVKSEREVTLQNSQIVAQRVNLHRANLSREIEWFFIETSGSLVALSINNPQTVESLEAIIHSFAPGELTDIGIEAITAVQAGREHLASQFGLDPYNVIVEALESHEWGNSCMDIVMPEQLCEDVPTAGYKLALRLGGQVFPYNVNEAGTLAAPEYPLGY